MLSEKQYLSFFRSSPNPSVLLKVKNSQFIIAGVNELFSQTVDVAEDDLLGQDLLRATSNNNINFYREEELLRSSLQQVVATKQTYRSDIYLFNSHYWRIENTPLLDESGKVEFIAHYLIRKGSHDLFSRKSDQYSFEELLEIKEHYKNSFEHDPDGLCSMDLEGKFLTANKSFERIAECNFDDIYNTSFAPLISPEDLEMVFDHFQKCINGEVQHYTARGITAKGNPTIANITNVPIKINNEIIGVYAIVKDITEKFKAEEVLNTLNAQLKTAQKISKISYVYQDFSQDKIYWSEEFFNLLGLENNVIVPGNEQFLKFVHPEDFAKVEQTIKDFYNDPKVVEIEFRIVQKNGTIKDVIFRSELIRDRHGKPKRLEGAFQDVTENKENEKLLRDLNERLNKKAEELTHVNAELEQFAYVASHDLKEPLRMINGFMQLLQKKYSDSLDETANMYITYALEGSKRMQQLISDLLRYSQILQEDSERKAVDLNAVYEEVRLNLLKQIEENNATIAVKNPLPVLKVNRSAILRLFQNLINNAIKFRKPDEAPEVIIMANEGKTHWVFSIVDNGIGILQKDYDKIFQLFSRLHLKTEYPGSGIGLAKCKKIVQHHNGEIWVESEPGKGSAFHFTLEKS